MRITGIQDFEKAKQVLAVLKNKDIQQAIKLTGIQDLEKAKAAVEAIKQKQASIALKVLGSSAVDDAQKILDKIQGKTIATVLKVTGTKDVENAKRIIEALKNKDIQQAIKLTGIKDVDQAKKAIESIQKKQASIALKVLGVPEVTLAKKAVDDLHKKNGKTVTTKIKVDGVSQARNDVSALGGSLASMAGQAAAFTGLTIGAATLGNEIRKAIVAVMDLDSAMSSVAAVGGLDKTSAEFERLTGVVVQLGATTRYTSTEAAMGLKELVAAGYSTVDASKILGDTLNLASTENISLAETSEIVVAGMQAMGLSVDQSTRFVDVLARGANSSTASVRDMGESLKYVAPVSKALGISLEETSAALAILANNGVRGGMAGRGLNAVFAKLVAPTKDAEQALRRVGLRASDLNPQIVGLEAALKNLKSLGQEDLIKMFGVENLDVSNILASNAAGFDKMTRGMKEASVTAKSMGDLNMDNLKGDLDELGAAFEALQIKLVGGDFYKGIRDDVQAFTKYLNDNRDAIASNIEKVGSLAIVLGKVMIAYQAIKGVKLVGELIATAVRWAAETKLIDLNTGALGRNAAARRAAAGASAGIPSGIPSGTELPPAGSGKGGKGGKGGKTGKGSMSGGIIGSAGAIAGGLIGYELAPDDAGALETTAYSIGGGVVGEALLRGVTRVGGPMVRAGLTKILGGSAATMTAAATTTGTGVGVSLGTAAVAGFGLAMAGLAVAGVYAIKNIEGARDASLDQFESVNDLGNQMLATSRRMVEGARNEVEMAKAKKLIQQQISTIYDQIADAEENGGTYTEEQIKNLQLTEKALAQIYNNAEKINKRKQDQLAAEKAIQDHNEKVRSIEQERARLSAEIAENLRQQVEAAKEFNQAYDERRDTAVSGLAEPARLEASGDDFVKARGEAEQIRKNLDEAAKSATAVANELIEGSKATALNNLSSDAGNVNLLASLPAKERALEAYRELDTRVKPYDVEPPTGGIVEFTQAPIDGPKMTDPYVQGPKITFNTAPAFTDLESIATYYKKVLDEAKASGNIELQAKVEGYMADLDKAVKASVEAGRKIEQALQQRDAQVRQLLPTSTLEVRADYDFTSALKSAEDARSQIDAILAEQGMEPLVDPAKEFKNAEDIANYYRRTQNALTRMGKVDLLTKEPFSKLTDAMNKNDSAAKEQDRVKGVQDSRAMQMKQLEMQEATANNDPRRAAQLGAELDLMKEQASIASAMNLTGKEGQAEAKRLAARKLGADLKVDLNEKTAEMNPFGNGPRQLGSGATAMNQLFGRSSNSGLLENAREQSRYLKELVELAKIKERIQYVATIS
jgi:TP901 family phage tail tape measure protein